ncbi:MAG: U32 family peptidase [Candidatus Spyradosoma sp.]
MDVRTPRGEDRNVFSPKPTLIPVVRELAQLDAALASGAKTIYAEFENPRDYKTAAERVHAAAPDAEFWAQPPRVFKQADDEAGVLRLVRECGADGFLVRAHEHLYAFAGARLRGDFSLNVANHLTAEHFLRERGLERVTASYDMNLEQLCAMLARVPAPEKIEVTLHQHMPMFHMEHCVFCTFLSEGKDFRDCGRPCEKHVVRLRDRTGLEHLVKADAGCRNTVYNARAQTGAEFFAELREAGVRFFRVEFVDEPPALVSEILARYRDLLAGKIDGNALWRGLRLESKLGVTRGTLKG